MSVAEMFDKLAMECVEKLRSRIELEHGWTPSVEAVKRIKVGKGSAVSALCEVGSGQRGELIARPADPGDVGKVALAIRRRGLLAKVVDGGISIRCTEGDSKRGGARAKGWIEPVLVELRKARRAAIDAQSGEKWNEGASEARELAERMAYYEAAARSMIKGAGSK